MQEGRNPLEEAGGVFALPREDFEACCQAEAGDRGGWARAWGLEGVDLKLASDPDVSPCIRLDGFWESGVTRGIARWVRDGATVWNIGGNVGYFAAMFALLAGHRGRVVAFEPQQDLAACIVAARRDARLRRLEVVEAAVGRYARRAPLHAGKAKDDGVHRGSVSLIGSKRTDVWAPAVEVLALDALTDRYGRPDLIFCDAEGAEEEIFLGSALLAEQRPVLCIEWAPYRYLTPRTFARFLADCGYRPFKFDDDGQAKPFDLEGCIDRDEWEQVLLVPEGPAPRRKIHDPSWTHDRNLRNGETWQAGKPTRNRPHVASEPTCSRRPASCRKSPSACP